MRDEIRINLNGVTDSGSIHRLPEKQGSIDASLYFKFITDIIARVPIDGDDSAPANVGKGEAYGAQISMRLWLKRLRLPTALLRLTLNWDDSRFTDPLTLETRSTGGDSRKWDYRISYRHDLSAPGIVYGAAWRPERKTQSLGFDRNDHSYREGDLDAFVEKRLGKATTLVFYVDNLLGTDIVEERIRFNGARTLDDIREIRRSESYRGTRYHLELKGRF